jgi:hypothetical protein
VARRAPEWEQRSGASNACGKIAYATRRAARADAQRADLRPGSSGIKMRAYRCQVDDGGCGWWHNGHLPKAVRRGELTAREAYGQNEVESMAGQRPIDMTEGVLTPRETAARFGVSVQTVYQWGRTYQANNPGCNHTQLAGFLTPGNEWRFSVKAVREALGG